MCYLPVRGPVGVFSKWDLGSKKIGTKETKCPPQNKIEHNLPNFWAADSSFCMEVCMDSPNKVQKYKKVHKYKSTHNSAIFWATDFRLRMEVYMDCQTKWQSTIVQKVQNAKVQKYKSTK